MQDSHDEAYHSATRRSSGLVQQCSRDLVTTVLNSLEMLLPEQLVHTGTTAPHDSPSRKLSPVLTHSIAVPLLQLDESRQSVRAPVECFSLVRGRPAGRDGRDGRDGKEMLVSFVQMSQI